MALDALTVVSDVGSQYGAGPGLMFVVSTRDPDREALQGSVTLVGEGLWQAVDADRQPVFGSPFRSFDRACEMVERFAKAHAY